MSLPTKISRRYIRALSEVDEFKERAEGKLYVEVVELAYEYFEEVGAGQEAFVFSVGPQRVLKVSDDERNLRGEYVIFRDPKYQEVTPQAYDHGENWTWVTVEKVESLMSWNEVWDYFPGMVDEKVDLKAMFMRAPEHIQDGDPPEWLNYLPPEEKEFFYSVADLFDDLALKAQDIHPQNMGVDHKGRVVLLDILTTPP